MQKSKLLAFALTLFSLAPGLTGQCGNVRTVWFDSYGDGLPLPAESPRLSGQFDAPNCTISLHLAVAMEEPPIPLVRRILLIGSTPLSLRVPGLGLGTWLLVQPDIIVFDAFPGPLSRYLFVIPPGIPLAPSTVYVQVVNIHFDPDEFRYHIRMSNGLATMFE